MVKRDPERERDKDRRDERRIACDESRYIVPPDSSYKREIQGKVR